MGTTRERMQLVLEIADALERNLNGKNFQDFVANPDLAAAVERYLERISAALGHMSQLLQVKHPDVDWEGIANIGNLLRHVYDRDLDQQVWHVAKSNVPELKRALLATVEELDSGKSR